MEVYKMNYIYGKPVKAIILTNNGKKKIKYDNETGKWKGTKEEVSAIKRFLKRVKDEE